MSNTPMFIQNLRPTEILIILLIVLLLFGAKRLPDLARGVGRSMRIFKAETRELRDDEQPDDDERRSERDEQPRPEARELEVKERAEPEPEHNPVSEGVDEQLKRDA